MSSAPGNRQSTITTHLALGARRRTPRQTARGA
eukprot:CAMPEP_0183364200 /NCGR_PEP_ID=MMETSP0164_2-20130417/78913_1 /TAXON_ID=221442 /ORGANISM="Coccolithus pelagicus ssp braarudi, Strain PLY182g" /LENGTH=32 /DNA_ID= /DNA_START= /DNA_END= /DNA_ORIENTATION=